jgi:glycine cleavage system H protein
MRGAATQAMRCHRRGAATKQTPPPPPPPPRPVGLRPAAKCNLYSLPGPNLTPLEFAMTTDPNDEIKFIVDKFIFRFPRKLLYSQDGLWIMQEDGLLRIGMSDFIQQRNGDIAFATPAPTGTALNAGDEIASIETVKVNYSLPSPMKGKIVEVNESLRDAPEFINQEPYGRGWMVIMQPENLEQDRMVLMTAEAYANLARQQAEAELKS